MATAVQVEEVSKLFRIYHERHQTFKERLVRMGSQKYEEHWALDEVSLTVDEGESVGLIGANGSGKTTLLKIIAGILTPTTGRVKTHGRVAALLELGAGFHPDLTGRENVYMNASIMGLSKKETDQAFDAIVAFSELERFIDNQVKYYSSGMYVRLGFAVAVHVDPEILLVDEVLSVGDEAFQRKCLERVRAFQREGRTIVFVTHAVDLVRTICSVAFFLHHGKLVDQGEPPGVIRSFRDSIHGEAHIEAAPTEEKGTQEIRITGAQILDQQGQEQSVFHPGDPLEVRAKLEARVPIEDPVVGIAFFDEKDQVLFGTNTAARGMELGTLNGRSEVSFAVPALPVLQGTCRVTLGVHSRDEKKVYHWIEKAYAFQVVNGGPDTGSANFDLSMKVRPD